MKQVRNKTYYIAVGRGINVHQPEHGQGVGSDDLLRGHVVRRFGFCLRLDHTQFSAVQGTIGVVIHAHDPVARANDHLVQLGVPQGPDCVRAADLHLAHLIEIGLIQENELPGRLPAVHGCRSQDHLSGH